VDNKDNKRRKLEIGSLLDQLSLGEDVTTDKEEVEIKPKKSILNIDISINKKNAQNKTFYLDKDVLAKLSKTAKHMGLSESRLINEILRKVLN
jgi:hypothetical protein